MIMKKLNNMYKGKTKIKTIYNPFNDKEYDVKDGDTLYLDFTTSGVNVIDIKTNEIVMTI